MSKTLKIEKIAYGGEGIAFLDGKVWFVQGALPGETVEAEMLQDKKKFIRARLLKITEASPLREKEPCPYVKDCGGCQYQHTSYAEELKWKEIQVREYLSRNLKIGPEKVSPMIGASDPYRYRNSVTVHRAPKDRSGFFSEDNENVTPVDDCLLADERLKPAFSTPWTGIRKKISYKLSAEGQFISEESDRIFTVNLNHQPVYTSAKSFFQNNLEMTAKIGEKLLQWTLRENAQTFMDLYCGVGTFSVLAAGKSREIVAVEDNQHSQQALRKNLEALGIPHTVLDGAVEKVLPEFVSRRGLENAFVFADPPRVGMMPAAVQCLAGREPAKALAYLSCHLGSLTRDLGILLRGGRYQLDEAIPFDMFPRTKHIEILVLLKRKE